MTGQFHAPAALSPKKKRQIPTEWRVGGFQSQPGCCGEQTNRMLLSGIERRVVQPVVWVPICATCSANLDLIVPITFSEGCKSCSPSSCCFVHPTVTLPHSQSPAPCCQTVCLSVGRSWGSHAREIRTKFFWDVTPWSLADRHGRFGATCCLHLQVK